MEDLLVIAVEIVPTDLKFYIVHDVVVVVCVLCCECEPDQYLHIRGLVLYEELWSSHIQVCQR